MDAVFEGVQGILVPGGFGNRGIEGKLAAARYAREHGIPYLGICLGMQIAVMEFARHVCGLEGASSTEFNPDTPYPVIDIMEEQKGLEQTGGTMRLGAYRCRLAPDSRLHKLYGADEVCERHRHRYEFNNAYIETFAAARPARRRRQSGAQSGGGGGASRTTPGSWACSSIRSSSPVPTARIPCSPAWWARHCKTLSAGIRALCPRIWRELRLIVRGG